MARARSVIEHLLGPSLSAEPSAPSPPGQYQSPDEGCVWHFAYGANTCFSTLARRGVRPVHRDPAFVADPAIRMRFRHRGGEHALGVGRAGLFGALWCTAARVRALRGDVAQYWPWDFGLSQPRGPWPFVGRPSAQLHHSPSTSSPSTSSKAYTCQFTRQLRLAGALLAERLAADTPSCTLCLGPPRHQATPLSRPCPR
jgi:hypothetical protein